MLVEALYYVGELRLVQGETDLARRHFAAVVNVKVPYFVEHRLARAQLARMRSTAAVQ
jgi:lipoprotein NlpI